MVGVDDAIPASSPLNGALSSSASKDEALSFYKTQYEQLEAELADFQASSRELETELEKDVEEAEKRERQLREKVEALGYEVDEWKSKCKQSKAEANTAQNNLQKEITNLRDANRTMQLKLRDIEVANDDYERQARNTTSSLEDLESKFNVGIERNVLLEEEVKSGEKEREELRIENQRLRDELSDLKVEAEVRQDKLRHAEAVAERSRLRKPTPIQAMIPRPQSALSEHSPIGTSASSPTIATPPTKSVSSTTSDIQTPPSPPTSDRSIPASAVTPANTIKPRLSLTNSTTPKPVHFSSRAPRHSRLPSATGFATPASRRTTLNREPATLPSSTSLTQIRGLIGKMQKLEQRVQSARSKLPAPTSTPPRASPRPGSALSQAQIPSNITVRSSRKRTSATNSNGVSSTPAQNDGATDIFVRPSSRLSFGLPPPTPTREMNSNTLPSRPSSRASISSRQSISQLPGAIPSRPSSRQSTRTPLGHYPTQSERIARPRSSIGGSFAATHNITSSTSRLSNYGYEDILNGADEVSTPTPAFRPGKEVGSAIPMPSKRLSGTGVNSGRRTSSGLEKGDMGPPERRKPLQGIGETY